MNRVLRSKHQWLLTQEVLKDTTEDVFLNEDTNEADFETLCIEKMNNVKMVIKPKPRVL